MGRPGTFKPGQSGNPNGRPPKGYSITEMMKEMLNSEPEIKKAIGKAISEKAKSGDITAIKILWQYMDGMPVQDITSGGEKIAAPIIYKPGKRESDSDLVGDEDI